MLNKDFVDILVAGTVLLLLVFLGFGVQASEFFEESDSLKKLSIDDQEELFLLIYLKSDVNNEKISDLILRAENNDEAFEELKEATEEIIGLTFNDIEDYDIKIIYPNGQKRINDGSVRDYKEMKLPSLSGEVILILAGFEFDEK